MKENIGEVSYITFAMNKINKIVNTLEEIVINKDINPKDRIEAARIIALYLDDVIGYMQAM